MLEHTGSSKSIQLISHQLPALVQMDVIHLAV